jgi:Ni/Co efflux regulator RcnB
MSRLLSIMLAAVFAAVTITPVAFAADDTKKTDGKAKSAATKTDGKAKAAEKKTDGKTKAAATKTDGKAKAEEKKK